MDAKIRLQHELLAIETEHEVHAMLELVTPPAPHGDRPPLHLALVIDRSGSMAGPKLDTTKECAAHLIRRLQPTDHLALVDYDDEVRLLAGLAPVDRTALLAAIRGIEAGGSTNLSGGWLKGAEELRRARGDGLRRVLLLTDGLANVGITEPERLVELARGAQGSDIGTTTIGFGGDFDEHLLTAMADAGGGSAHFAATPDDAPGIFGREFEDLMAVVAQNVSVEIRPSDDVEMLGVLNEYPATAVPGGLQLALGDAYGEESRRVIFALRIPWLARLGVVEVAEVVIRYASVGDEVALRELRLPVRVNMVTADEAASAPQDRDVVEEVVILRAARAQEEARRHADTGDFDEARKVLTEAASDLRRTAAGSPRAEELTREADLLEDHGSRMDPAAYDPLAAKAVTYSSRDARRRRRPAR